MRIKLFTIPNLITLSSLVCGAVATVEVLTNQNYTLVFWLVILASIFDFLDGFVARLLSSESPLGRELDSLCDLVSFGVAPTFVLFSLTAKAPTALYFASFDTYIPYLTFVIMICSALRLAKFNIDTTQKSSFSGLPTPANALLCISLGMIHQELGVEFSREVLVVTSIVMSALMLLPLEMFSLKFSGFSWHGNRVRYLFLALCIAEIIILGLYALPAIIISYILISIAMALLPHHYKA